MGTCGKLGIKCANFIWSASFLHKMQRMENNFYCVIDNIEHDHLWRNSPSHFRMGFPNHVNFSGGDYECALMEFTCSTKNFPNKMPLAEIYICLNITAEPITGGDAECNLLRYAVVKWVRFQNMTFSVPYYVGVKPMKVSVLEVYIKDESGAEVSFLEGKMTCVLHFRRKNCI